MEKSETKTTLPTDVREWGRIIDRIPPSHIELRDTDHEFRVDTRNICWVKGFPLEYEISVESVALATETTCNVDLFPLKKHLYSLASGAN